MAGRKRFDDLLKLARIMRKKSGWHQAQSIEKFSKFVLEEAHEVQEAVRKKDWENLHEEIGDLMWDLAFLSEMAREQQLFSIHDSIHSAHKKVVRRNPHIFAGTKVKDQREVRRIYLKIKKQEKEAKQRKKDRKKQRPNQRKGQNPGHLKAKE